MAHRYAPLPNPSHDHDHRVTQHDREVEMQAAFDYSDDEDDERNATEAQPLNPTPTSPTESHSPPVHTPGTYNFETVDYDYPPPGSPPRPSATALPNNIGNSNGFIPAFTPPSIRGPHRMWLQRAAAAVLPASALSRMGIAPQRPSGPIGSGTNNDGVFANVTAKPTAPVRVQDGDDTYVVPEDTRQEAPPSYASAQADAVPPYWETTVHAPFAPDSIGDMVIENLPTGSFFSFCWNLLVSISFQFVGFLLTYLLHTSHAARLGSRAGLGVTLIQYGFALRSRMDSVDGVGDGNRDWDWNNPDGTPSDVHHGHHHVNMSNVDWNTPPGNLTDEQASILVANATSEWLSFFLMTIGWLVLLTSLLGFWRVKRWERNILASRGDSNPPPTAPQRGSPNVFSQFESTFGLHGVSRTELLRQGFGFGRRHHDEDIETERAVAHAEEGLQGSRESDPMIALDLSDPNRARAVADQQLLQGLRAAGF